MEGMTVVERFSADGMSASARAVFSAVVFCRGTRQGLTGVFVSVNVPHPDLIPLFLSLSLSISLRLRSPLSVGTQSCERSSL